MIVTDIFCYARPYYIQGRNFYVKSPTRCSWPHLGIHIVNCILYYLGCSGQNSNVLTHQVPFNVRYYYMTSSVSGQDQPNPVLWLATWVGKMELSYPLTARRVLRGRFLRKPYNKFFIDHACSVRMTGYWQKKTLANIHYLDLTLGL